MFRDSYALSIKNPFLDEAQEISDLIDWKIGLMYDAAEAASEKPAYDLGTCGGCGAYGRVYTTHIRNGEECGEFV